MKNNRINKFKYTFIIVLPALFLVFSFGFPVETAYSATTTVDGCKLSWEVVKKGRTKPIVESFTVYKNLYKDVFTAKLSVSGDSCSKFYGVYRIYEAQDPNNEKAFPIAPGSCDVPKNQEIPLDFTEFVSYKKLRLAYMIYDKSLKGCQETKNMFADRMMSIIATFSDKDDPTPSGDNTGGGGGGGGDQSQDPPIADVDKTKPGNLETIPGKQGPPLYNPLKVNTLMGLALNLLKFFFGGVAALAVVFVTLGAVQLTVSRGNPEALTKGKDTIIWSLIGVVVAVLAFSMVGIVQNILDVN